MNKNFYYITVGDYRRFHLTAYRAQQDGHREICGVIFENRGRIFLTPMVNYSENAYSYELSMDAIATEINENQDKEFFGTYHSHPVSEAYPSSRDIEESEESTFMLIHDVCGRVSMLWWVYMNEESGKKEIQRVNLKLRYRDNYIEFIE